MLSIVIAILLYGMSVLASVRVTRFITLESGPWWFMESIRDRLIPYDRWHSLVTCPQCVSVWVAIPLAIGLSYYVWWNPYFFVLAWLSLSMATVYTIQARG